MNELILYHSTTGLYLPSIKKLGLGGINPNYSLGILDFLKNLYVLSEQYLLEDEDYRAIRYSTRCMADQIITNHFNFKHDKIYLSINESTAIRYSSSNKYGSELLTRSIFLYKKLLYGYKVKIDTSMLKFSINELINRKYDKILLKVKKVDVENLETEDGGSAIKEIEKMAELRRTEPILFEYLSQQSNFTLKTPVDFSKIEAYKIELGYDKENRQTYKLQKYLQ